MKRPEKKEIDNEGLCQCKAPSICQNGAQPGYEKLYCSRCLKPPRKRLSTEDKAYNQACDIWEAYHDGFIATLNHAVDNFPNWEELCNLMAYSSLSNKEKDILAKAILKRIRGKNEKRTPR